ncbi:HU family DNA-binding protein [Lignipirellula cremea]|uniref:Integration host factor subunit beta n=1 Tax=Lignipirellula cremea TaxID=2528010 RepID=A0A518E094_9BACT|nr:HU family DNA-binding protein [Lignipirellula cremea]QDU97505.1 Integration host factor subunit beta [Lignipirellula cremea]
MTKKEIVKTISEEIGLTQLKTKEIVQLTFDAIIEALVEERRIELRNFGVFEVKKRAARKARNPRTGERVDVAEKYVVTFKPGKTMEERVRQLEESEAAQAAERRTQEEQREPPKTEPTSSPAGSTDAARAAENPGPQVPPASPPSGDANHHPNQPGSGLSGLPPTSEGNEGPRTFEENEPSPGA